MDIPYLIQLLQNKITILNNAKGQAFSTGDLDRINALDKDIYETQNTVTQLNLLLTATQAVTTNFDLSTVVNAGVQATQNVLAVPDSPLASLFLYDISTYAADPLYIQKISDILNLMPAMDNASEIDTYITKEVIGSPVTGQMIIDAVLKYKIDTRLLVSIMELDSRFGTVGVGAVTFNPGNVGNTGTSTRTFDSWSLGVEAVAEWLNNHRIDITLTAPVDTQTSTSTPATGNATTTPATDNATSTPATTNATSTSPVNNNLLPPVPFTITASSTEATSTANLATSTLSNSNATTTPVNNSTTDSATSTNPFIFKNNNDVASSTASTANATSSNSVSSTTLSSNTDTSTTTGSFINNNISSTTPVTTDISSSTSPVTVIETNTSSTTTPVVDNTSTTTPN